MRNSSCENHVRDYGADDSVVIYGAVAWAKPLKDFNLSYWSYNPREDFITSAQQIKHSAQGSKGHTMDNSEIKPTQNSATAARLLLSSATWHCFPGHDGEERLTILKYKLLKGYVGKTYLSSLAPYLDGVLK